MRRAAKVDNNQSDVIQWYRDLGYDVINTSPLGDGFPDLIAVKQHVHVEFTDGAGKIHQVANWEKIFVEVKRSKYSKFTEAQKKFNAKYPGLAVRVETVEDVVRSVE